MIILDVWLDGSEIDGLKLLQLFKKINSNIPVIMISGHSTVDMAVQAIKEGAIFGTVVQDPYRYGYESIRVLASLVRGDRSVLPPQGFLNIPARQIRQDNIENFWVELKTKLNSK